MKHLTIPLYVVSLTISANISSGSKAGESDPLSQQTGGMRIAAIVMPACTGKSEIAMTLADHQIYKSDDIVLPKSYPTLRKTREIAVSTGDWTLYNMEYAERLKIHLDDRDVILLPSRRLADQLGATTLATYYLPKQQWADLVKDRGTDITKHEICYEEARCTPGSFMIHDKKILKTAIMGMVYLWRYGLDL